MSSFSAGVVITSVIIIQSKKASGRKISKNTLLLSLIVVIFLKSLLIHLPFIAQIIPKGALSELMENLGFLLGGLLIIILFLNDDNGKGKKRSETLSKFMQRFLQKIHNLRREPARVRVLK